MKKLFIQFYLLLFVCFLVMSLLVGLVYKFTAERAGKQSLDDLMNSSLYLMRSELREIPPHDWGKTLKEMDLNLSFDLRVEPLSKYHLDDISMHRLRGGEIVALDDQYTFLQRIPRSHYVLAVGPVPYLYYLHQMRLLDIALIAFPAALALRQMSMVHDELPKYLLAPEVSALLHYVPDLRRKMLLATLWNTGARINEALALTRGDFSLAPPYPFVQLATLKQRTEKAARTAGRMPAGQQTHRLVPLSDSWYVSQLQTMVATLKIPMERRNRRTGRTEKAR
ncbi:TPA: hypothetical protein ACULBR_004167, partial [Escherichia coli]